MKKIIWFGPLLFFSLWMLFSQELMAQNVSFTISDTTHVYDGSATAPIISVSNPNANYTITYNGSSTVPVNAGVYAIYIEALPPYLGTLTSTLTILKAQAEINFADTIQMFDGQSKSITINTTPPNLSVGITYDGASTAPVNIGSYKAIATIVDTNSEGIDSVVFQIVQASSRIIVNDSIQTYDGSPKRLSVTTDPPGLTLSILYEGMHEAPTDAGVYSVEISINSNGFNGERSSSLTIEKAPATIQLTDTVFSFDGNGIPALSTTNPPNLRVDYLYNNSSAVPAIPGVYTLTATINETNYQGQATGTHEITKAQAQIMVTDTLTEYNGLRQGVGVQTVPPNLNYRTRYEEQTNAPIIVGQYQAITEIIDENYFGHDTSAFEIVKAQAQIQISDTITVYNGQRQGISLETVPPNLSAEIRYEEETEQPSNADSMLVSINIQDHNYKGTDTVMFVILRAPQQIQFDSVQDVPSNHPPFRLTGSSSSGLPLSYFVAEGNQAQVTEDTITVTGRGPVTVYAHQPGSTNYLPSDTLSQVFLVTAPYQTIRGQVIDLDGTIIQTGTVTVFLDTLRRFTPTAHGELNREGFEVIAPEGRYILRYNAPRTSRYLNTYFGNTPIWQNAASITLGDSTNDVGNFTVEYSPELLTGLVNIRGNLKDLRMSSEGTPLPDMPIYLVYPEDMRIYAVTHTDENGSFEFENIRRNNYILQVDKPGLSNQRVFPYLDLDNSMNNLSVSVEEHTSGFSVRIDSANSVLGLPDAIVSVFPNPASDFLNIETEGPQIDAYSLYTTDGKLLLKEKMAKNNKRINLKSFPGQSLILILERGKERRKFRILHKK